MGKRKWWLYLAQLLQISIILLLILIMSGCWDRIEINDLATITSASIDYSDDNEIELSVAIFLPKSYNSGQSSGGGGGSGEGQVTMVMSGRGKSLAAAIADVQKELPRKIFWGHCRVFIFSEKVAELGIKEHLDFLLRHPQPRERAFIFVSKGKARGLLELKTQLERYSAESIREIAKSSVGLKKTMQNIDEMFYSETKAFALPYLKITTEKTIEKKQSNRPIISGSAIFKDDQMIGTISEYDTRGILWLKDELKDYTVTFSPHDTKGTISLNPVTAKIDITPKIHADQWSILVDVYTEGTVIQNTTGLSVADPQSLKKMEKAYKNDIKNRIEGVINVLQEDFKADIAGFGTQFHRHFPKQWKQVKNHWEEKFSEVQVNVQVTAIVQRQGFIKEYQEEHKN